MKAEFYTLFLSGWLTAAAELLPTEHESASDATDGDGDDGGGERRHDDGPTVATERAESGAQFDNQAESPSVQGGSGWTVSRKQGLVLGGV